MITDIFCSPIQEIPIKDYQFISVVNKCYEELKEKKIFKNNWMPGNDTAPTTFMYNSNIFEKNLYVKMFLESKCANYLDNVGFSFKETKLMDSWFNEQGKNQVVGLHNHRNVRREFDQISGAFYVKTITNPKQGQITFVNHNPYEGEFPLNSNILKYNNEVSLTARENNMVLFPASLNHKVTPNFTNKTRVVVSFNIMYK
jgi:uncharacterized protein (TIGR02466 family)